MCKPKTSGSSHLLVVGKFLKNWPLADVPKAWQCTHGCEQTFLGLNKGDGATTRAGKRDLETSTYSQFQFH